MYATDGVQTGSSMGRCGKISWGKCLPPNSFLDLLWSDVAEMGCKDKLYGGDASPGEQRLKELVHSTKFMVHNLHRLSIRYCMGP